MKGVDAIIFWIGVAIFLIAIYEAMVLGIGQAYGIFMISLILFFVYGYRKRNKKK
ncbi:MAG: hypothetical protein KI791_14225 [Cyclobacteriaceae bacterium]|nr:hypothetical protein [Cyclobacteriaceae bacterium SS2]